VDCETKRAVRYGSIHNDCGVNAALEHGVLIELTQKSDVKSDGLFNLSARRKARRAEDPLGIRLGTH